MLRVFDEPKELRMNGITLQESTLIEEIEKAATDEGVDAATFVTDAVRQRLARFRQKRIAIEADAWYRLPAEERKRYVGKFVAALNEKIIGTGSDPIELLFQMRERFGKQPILIIEGGDQSMPTYQNTSCHSAN